MRQKDEKKKGERYLKCTKGGGSVAFHRKITITGVMQETKETTQIYVFAQLRWCQRSFT